MTDGAGLIWSSQNRQTCYSSLDDNGDHIHECEFPAEHTDWDHDGSHQCECGQLW